MVSAALSACRSSRQRRLQHATVCTATLGILHCISEGSSALRAFSVRSAGGVRLAGVDLSARWRELVAAGAIVATVPSGPSGEVVSYGVRLGHDKDFEEFVIGNATLNATLAAGQTQRCVQDGSFFATLQLVRTLRPAPSPGIGLPEVPPYDPSKDSFVSGPLRLQLRPRAASLHVESTGRNWDCFHNISPCDIRGHFLLLPTIKDQANWRRQALTTEDCVDLVWLARSTVDGDSSPWLITFNAVRAGASQNHVHCHVWGSPPLPLAEAKSSYAIQRAVIRKGIPPHVTSAGVEVALLEHPCTTVRLRGGSASAAGAALAAVVAAVEELGMPFNLALLGGTAWIFVRSPSGERSPLLPAHKLGASEMCGHFHCSSMAQLDLVASPGFMAAALSSVSSDALSTWNAVIAKLRTSTLSASL